jgi:ribose transport system permease protein
MALLVVAAYIAFSLSVAGFNSEATVTNILLASATDGLLAIALTVPLLAGEIDLSIGSNLALSGVIFVTLQPHYGIALAAVCVVLSGGLLGLINGFFVVAIRVNSFVATLAMLFLAQSVALTITGGNSAAGTSVGFSLRMSDPLFGPITIPFLLLAAVAFAAEIFVGRTPPGRDIIAIGGNREAAVLAGIPVGRRLYLALLLSGLIAALSGAQLAATTLSGAPTSGGTNLLTAATAVFLGGVSLTGGRGSPIASALAVVALSTLQVGLQLSNASSGIQNLVTGGVLVLVVAIRAISVSADGRSLGRELLALVGATGGPSAAQSDG